MPDSLSPEPVVQFDPRHSHERRDDPQPPRAGPMTVPLSNEQREELRRQIEAAKDEIVRLAHPGGRGFRMTVPVEPTDSDIVLMDGLNAASVLLDALDAGPRSEEGLVKYVRALAEDCRTSGEANAAKIVDGLGDMIEAAALRTTEEPSRE